MHLTFVAIMLSVKFISNLVFFVRFCFLNILKSVIITIQKDTPQLSPLESYCNLPALPTAVFQSVVLWMSSCSRPGTFDICGASDLCISNMK